LYTLNSCYILQLTLTFVMSSFKKNSRNIFNFSNLKY